MILNAMILNQYTGKATGATHYYTTRVIEYCIGIVLALIASFSSPW